MINQNSVGCARVGLKEGGHPASDQKSAFVVSDRKSGSAPGIFFGSGAS